MPETSSSTAREAFLAELMRHIPKEDRETFEADPNCSFPATLVFDTDPNRKLSALV